jgi:hypothetical protein
MEARLLLNTRSSAMLCHQRIRAGTYGISLLQLCDCLCPLSQHCPSPSCPTAGCVTHLCWLLPDALLVWLLLHAPLVQLLLDALLVWL